MFSEIIENINEGKWIFDEKIPLVYEIDESSAMKIKFFIDNVKVIYGSAKELDLNFTDFSNFSFDYKTKKNESGQKECFGTIFFNGKKLFERSESLIKNIELLFAKFSKNFTDETCSPRFQVESLIEEFNLAEETSYNSDLWASRKTLIFVFFREACEF